LLLFKGKQLVEKFLSDKLDIDSQKEMKDISIYFKYIFAGKRDEDRSRGSFSPKD
jgi:hypothetical protein